METEKEIFDQLSDLCAKPGFIHALVAMHFSDNYFKADRKNNFTVSSVAEHEADKSKLNRNEVNTLLALIIKNNNNFIMDKLPSEDILVTGGPRPWTPTCGRTLYVKLYSTQEMEYMIFNTNHWVFININMTSNGLLKIKGSISIGLFCSLILFFIYTIKNQMNQKRYLSVISFMAKMILLILLLNHLEIMQQNIFL